MTSIISRLVQLLTVLSLVSAATVMEYACFNNVLDLHCPSDHVLVLESARYGRNDTTLAAACNTPFKRNCDIDVHFIMNRLCSGRSACALVVSSELFRDPCGYEEFLKVVYSCVPGKDLSLHITLQWRHNERDGVSNHQRLVCLLNCLFRRRAKKILKLRVAGLFEGNPAVTGGFPSQRTSNAENVFIWWRHLGWGLNKMAEILHATIQNDFL